MQCGPLYGPRREFSGTNSFRITVLPDLLNKMRIFSHMWGPCREFSGPTYFEIITLPDLLDKMQSFYMALVVNLVVQILLK